MSLVFWVNDDENHPESMMRMKTVPKRKRSSSIQSVAVVSGGGSAHSRETCDLPSPFINA